VFEDEDEDELESLGANVDNANASATGFWKKKERSWAAALGAAVGAAVVASCPNTRHPMVAKITVFMSARRSKS